MQSNVAGALLLTFYFCLGSVALAQEDEVEEQQPVIEQSAQEQVAETAGETVEQKSEVDEKAPPDADTERERSPHDYRPSEDISEDLSVSFPVDI